MSENQTFNSLHAPPKQVSSTVPPAPQVTSGGIASASVGTIHMDGSEPESSDAR